MKYVHISVAIPVYRAENCLDELYQRLIIALESITTEFEIILVEDCGDDNSWQVIERIAAADSRILGIQLTRNFGQHYAITAGLDNCKGDWVVVMDCDLQDRPEEIPHLYAKALEGYDIVLALRGTRQDPLLKQISSWAFYKIFSYLADIKYDGDSGNFRILSRTVVTNFCQMREQLRFFSGLIQWMGFPTASIQVKHSASYDGKSSYTFYKLWNLSIDTIIAYSEKPLRLSIGFGFIIAITSFFFGIYFFCRTLFYGAPVQGWATLIVSLYFIGGNIIVILGVIGIYLGKTFNETKRRPLYIVSQTTFTDKKIRTAK